jgi:hypothetical protein
MPTNVLMISIVSLFLYLVVSFESQIQTPLAGFPFSVSLSIPEWSPLIEVSSKMPREILYLLPVV